MNLDQTGDVLAKLAAYDQRTIGEADLLAWHEIIGSLNVADCLAAVTAHYREQTNRAMPSDIRHLAVGIRDQRQTRERQAAGRLAIESAPTTTDRSADVTALVQAVAAALPQPDAHQRAVSRARSERGRPAAPLPKARKRPKPKDYPEPATDDIAAMATRYLLDGHHPGDVAERLAVSRSWCEKTLIRLKGAAA